MGTRRSTLALAVAAVLLAAVLPTGVAGQTKYCIKNKKSGIGYLVRDSATSLGVDIKDKCCESDGGMWYLNPFTTSYQCIQGTTNLKYLHQKSSSTFDPYVCHSDSLACISGITNSCNIRL